MKFTVASFLYFLLGRGAVPSGESVILPTEILQNCVFERRVHSAARKCCVVKVRLSVFAHHCHSMLEIPFCDLGKVSYDKDDFCLVLQ